jgi:hypothetical protein
MIIWPVYQSACNKGIAGQLYCIFPEERGVCVLTGALREVKVKFKVRVSPINAILFVPNPYTDYVTLRNCSYKWSLLARLVYVLTVQMVWAH